MAGKSKAVEVAQNDTSAEKLIQQAIAANVPVETLERLLAMRTQIRVEQAKEGFNKAMAAFQAECPTIVKTKEVKTRSGVVAYRYAPIESIVAQVKRPLKNNGFSYTTQIDLTEKGVKAIIKVTHEQGHSEETSMEVPLGTKTDIMSNSQVTAAASTFAKRYAFCNAFGILTGDEDTDGADFDKSEVDDSVVPTVTYGEEDDMRLDEEGKPDFTPKNTQPTIVIPKDVVEQRKLLFTLLKKRGVDVKDAKACRQYVANEFQLSLVENNFPLLINKLS